MIAPSDAFSVFVSEGGVVVPGVVGVTVVPGTTVACFVSVLEALVPADVSGFAADPPRFPP